MNAKKVNIFSKESGTTLVEIMIAVAIMVTLMYMAYKWYNQHIYAETVAEAKKNSTELAEWVMKHVQRDHDHNVEHMNTSQTDWQMSNFVTMTSSSLKYIGLSEYETQCKDSPSVGARRYTDELNFALASCNLKCSGGKRQVIVRRAQKKRKGQQQFEVPIIPDEKEGGKKIKRDSPVAACIGAETNEQGYQVFVIVAYLDMPKAGEKDIDKGTQKFKYINVERLFNARNLNTGIEIQDRSKG